VFMRWQLLVGNELASPLRVSFGVEDES
jgi:hypothetical protein